jgi:hypothetical protein
MKQTSLILMLFMVVGSTAIAGDATVGQDGLNTAVSESEPATEDSESASPLHDLAWMVGRWIDESDEARITTECSWSHGEKFLKRSFQITTDDEVVLTGTQMIGWDPIEERIRSWTFDSEGGRGEGRWFRDGDRWLVKTSFVLATGERASAINVITYIDDDTLRWQSTNREIGGELQPNIPEVTVVREKQQATNQ